MKPVEVERLYGLYGHRVYLKCRALLQEDQAAMDAVQDVFTALLSKFLAFPDDSRAGAWLMKVATNKSLNEIRRRKYWRSNPIQRDGQEGNTNPFPVLDDRLFLNQALLAFDRDKAPIIVAYCLEGMTLEETAEETGFSVPTVRRTIATFLERARARAGTGR